MTTTLTFIHGGPDFDWKDILQEVLQSGAYGQADAAGLSQVTLVVATACFSSIAPPATLRSPEER